MTHGNNNGEYDVFKDSPMRYLGYANELGEAFRAFIPKSVVLATYGIATVYALGDATDKGYKAYSQGQEGEEGAVAVDGAAAMTATSNATSRTWRVAERTTDTAIWQLLASVTVPAYIINRVVHTTNYSLNKFVAPSSTLRGNRMFKLLPTLAGLAIIPILPHVLDPVIDVAMDNTTRPLFRYAMSKNQVQQQQQLEVE